MQKRNVWRTTTLLLLAFIILAVGGRMLFYSSTKQETDTQPAAVKEQSSVQKSSATSDSNASADKSASTDTSISGCAEQLAAKIAADKTDYDKHSLLVTFNTDVNFSGAVSTLATYGLTVQNQSDAQSSFNSRHLITATLPSGDLLTKICVVKRDASVRYAGINPLFGLHE